MCLQLSYLSPSHVIRLMSQAIVWSPSVDSCSSRSPLWFSLLFHLSVPLPFHHTTTQVHLIKAWLIFSPHIYYSYSLIMNPLNSIRPLQFYEAMDLWNSGRPSRCTHPTWPWHCWSPWPWPTNLPPCFRLSTIRPLGSYRVRSISSRKVRS
jgi:hypothetical protein